MTQCLHHPGASKKAAPAPPPSEEVAPEQKVAVIQPESIKCDSG